MNKTYCITWRNVLAPGALVFSIMERTEKMMIWMVTPAPYQYGPLMPNCSKNT